MKVVKTVAISITTVTSDKMQKKCQNNKKIKMSAPVLAMSQKI